MKTQMNHFFCDAVRLVSPLNVLCSLVSDCNMLCNEYTKPHDFFYEQSPLRKPAQEKTRNFGKEILRI